MVNPPKMDRQVQTRMMQTRITCRYIDAKTRVPRRVVTFNHEGKKALTVDTLRVILGPPPRKLFEIPTGYKRAYRRKTR